MQESVFSTISNGGRKDVPAAARFWPSAVLMTTTVGVTPPDEGRT
jgi:hypothetical protein